MIALYSLLLWLGLSIYTVITVFGLFVAGTMSCVLWWFHYNRRVHAAEVERLLAFARAEDTHVTHRIEDTAPGLPVTPHDRA